MKRYWISHNFFSILKKFLVNSVFYLHFWENVLAIPDFFEIIFPLKFRDGPPLIDKQNLEWPNTKQTPTNSNKTTTLGNWLKFTYLFTNYHEIVNIAAAVWVKCHLMTYTYIHQSWILVSRDNEIINQLLHAPINCFHSPSGKSVIPSNRQTRIIGG